MTACFETRNRDSGVLEMDQKKCSAGYHKNKSEFIGYFMKYWTIKLYCEKMKKCLKTGPIDEAIVETLLISEPY